MAASKGPEFSDLFTSDGGSLGGGSGGGGDQLLSSINGSSPYDHLISSSLGIYDPYRNVAAGSGYGQHSVYRVPQRQDEDYHQTYHHNEVVDIDPGEKGTFTTTFGRHRIKSGNLNLLLFLGCRLSDGRFYSGGQTWDLPGCGRGVCAKVLQGGWQVAEDRSAKSEKMI